MSERRYQIKSRAYWENGFVDVSTEWLSLTISECYECLQLFKLADRKSQILCEYWLEPI